MSTTTATARMIALRVGLDADTVKSACARALVEHDGQGRYPLAEAEAACRTHVDADKVRGHMLGGRGDMEPAQLARLAPGAEFAGGVSARREVDLLKAEKMRLDMDERRGLLVSRASVERSGQDIIRRATHHMLGLPKRAARRLVGTSDPQAIRAVLDDEVNATLKVLSDLNGIMDEILGLA